VRRRRTIRHCFSSVEAELTAQSTADKIGGATAGGGA